MASPVGLRAEAWVAQRLKTNGYKILAQNWSTPRCEIDIVALKDDVIYMVEVKYRSGSAQGSGFDYIGPRKRRQLEYAARVWQQESSWEGDMRLLAAEVSGNDFEPFELVELS